ncbi:MAG: SRPBCC family protein [Mangrovimonas sp.]|nr:SRPBCC family protein [Mangrovimonas sp.]
MKMKSLHKVQVLPIMLKEAWDFFSSPGNLKTITPPYMGFNITSAIENEKMYEGMIISYLVKPLLNIPIQWVTQISHVKEPYYFVDFQLKGPYKFWHHQHHFRQVDGGVEMKDILHYEVAGGIFGRLIENILIEKRVEQIFNYREQKLQDLFPVNG